MVSLERRRVPIPATFVGRSIRPVRLRPARHLARGEVHVKVFGSAEVVGIAAAAKPAIGKLDSEAAIEVLEAEGFKIIASSLGGSLGRQLQFHTGTGEVALRGLGKTRAEDVVDE
jgi:chemotaxis receptor (MCP) glutamine deamidase CheD